MSTTVTRSMRQLIDEAIDYVMAYEERPIVTTIGTQALASGSATQFTLSDWSAVQPPMVIEVGSELIQVTAKSDDPVPVFTAGIRGYLGTPATAHSAGELVLVQPRLPRQKVQRAIEQAFDGTIGRFLPLRKFYTVELSEDRGYAEVAADVLDIVDVDYLTATNELRPLPAWDWKAGHPLSTSGTGVLTYSFLPACGNGTLEVYVECEVPYTWSQSPPSETATIQLPAGAADLPMMYVAALLTTGRAVSEGELDKITEWNEQEAARQGFTLRTMQLLWQNFYRRLGEARGMLRPKVRRPWISRPRPPRTRIWGAR